MPQSALGNIVFNAFRANLIPGLFLQAFALALGLSYFFIPASLPAFEFFADLKSAYGWRYSVFATAFFGGLLPFLYLRVKGLAEGAFYPLLTFQVLFWGLKGLEVDLFYRFQGWLFGYDASALTIAKKVIVDQFIYSALWAAPSIVLLYIWRDCGFQIRSSIKAWQQKELWQLHIPSVIVSNWLLWIPAVSVVYSMPPALQVPLFNVVLCFFVLLVASLSNKNPTKNT
ncbi:hypothetical protein [Agaribacterium haliotis]|uniref:hypothetical protein n=1 Tax=Agaribacterium haliotis TaxID=2013869 RepID=UPI000BB5989B|nr:hypothetical protein [Agaribacterium haliotis]